MRIQAAVRWLALALLGMTGPAGAAQPCGLNCEGNWVAAWGTAQQLAQPVRAIPAAVTPPAKVARQTVRMIARPTVSGSALRVALSNSFGFGAVRIDAAHVARHAGGGAIDAGSGQSLTFGGRPWVVLPPGAQLYSDPLPFEVAAQADLAISLYLEADSGPTTAHPIGLRTAWLAPGNQVSATRLNDAATFSSYLWLAGIDVRAADNAATIVAFGDSITDGFSTTPDADLPWPSILARRLAAQRNQPPRAVINMGISGNRVLREDAGSSALARFDRDVLSRPGTRWVLLLEGINDIGFLAFAGNNPAEQLTVEDIITGYRMLIGRARLHGLRIIGGTLTPFEGVPTYSEAAERMRQQVNAWIRTSGAFDAVVDFDAVTRDPAAPTKLRAEYDSGDHIHPNDAGNKAMADAIDLKLFR
ncbi:MAG TPA: SGNH/GDSL hydrolase family protein [Steroidobacteraceae bacterium]|nr:SGNH/GDSL hydrolase family protein [Steroidobacteraceae bacterium]